MSITNKPDVKRFKDGSRIWEHTFENFISKVYVPKSEVPDELNLGFDAPYFLVFEEKENTLDVAKAFADERGLSEVAKRFSGSVVFIYPTAEKGWDGAGEVLFTELIENSKIHQYYEDGMVVLNNRFTKQCEGYAIRGAIFRTMILASGKAADYVATKLLKKTDGAGLWGPADVTIASCVLENLSVSPKLERDDIPVVSVGNSESINAAFKAKCKYFIEAAKSDYVKLYDEFLKKYYRWVGTLCETPDLDKLNMKLDMDVACVNTSKDNEGDDKGTAKHNIGYLAYYNKDLFDKGPAPLLLAFHGGGDSALYISNVSEWYKVANDHNFLLVCIENHLNSTASEMIELIEILKSKYSINPEKIYGSGFSMGGCKSWDLYQEYPNVFAGLAPMDATFEVGLNVYGKEAPVKINEDVPVPIFYTGGEVTPLPELPCQAVKCLDRMQYVFKVNKIKTPHTKSFDNQSDWEDKIWGIVGDTTKDFYDETRDSYLKMNYFESADGKTYTAFGAVTGQGHECRHHTCDQAWRFLSRFSRLADGSIKED